MERRKYIVGAAFLFGLYYLYSYVKHFIESRRFKYEIRKQWDGQDATKVTSVEFRKVGGVLEIHVTAPFYNDPPAPNGAPGEPFPQLWDYEVVEVFFLSDSGKYLEVELCPHGQHLVLLLDGRRNIIKERLAIKFTSHVTGNQWIGKASIPLDYFPAHVSKFNLYAIHGTRDGTEIYEAYSPVPGPQPDFHRLEYFANIDFATLVPENYESNYVSSVWS